MSVNPPPSGMRFVNPAAVPAVPQAQVAAVTPAPARTGPARPAPPPANFGWVVLALIVFWPLAIPAANHAFDVIPRWHMGDQSGAEQASARVKRLGLIALTIWAVLTSLFILLVVAIYQAGGF